MAKGAVMSGKGGARHTSKPQVDSGLLFRCLIQHKDLVCNLGPYEAISKTQAANPKGLLKNIPLIKGLVQLESTGEIHASCIRNAVFQMVLEDPKCNDSKWSGGVWTNMRAERIGTLLFHIRRLKLGDGLRNCASKLTAMELLSIQEVLELMDRKLEVEEPALPLVKREKQREDSPLAERDAEASGKPAKKLKKEISDVSLDSMGMPKCFGTPSEKASPSPLAKGVNSPQAEEEPSSSSLAKKMPERNSLPKGNTLAKEIAEPSFLRRREGRLAAAAASSAGEKANLKSKLGMVAKMKRPAAKLAKKASAKKKPLKKGPVTTHAGASPAAFPRKVWTKLQVTKSQKEPWRAYICGTTADDGKPPLHLIVETRHKNHVQYLEILQHIKDRLEQDHLTKDEAVQLRKECYDTW